MDVKFELRKNHLTGNGDYRARVIHAGVAGIEEIVDHIERQGSTVTRTDILGVLEGFHNAVESYLLKGFKVHTPTANYGIGVKGSFEQADLDFDPTRHRVVGVVTQGRRLRKTLRERCRVARTDPSVKPPTLLTYLDANSGEHGATLTPGGLGRVVGHRLQFDPADPAQGITLVDGDGGETRVTVVLDNTATRLTFQVPNGLAPGGYTLEVRTANAKGTPVTGVLDETLTV